LIKLKRFFYTIATQQKLILIFVMALSILLSHVGFAAADSTTPVNIPTGVTLDSLSGVVNIFVNFLRIIGVPLLLLFGYWHTFSVSAHAKNATKRAVAMEGLMWVAISTIIFVMAPYIIGVLSGVGTTIKNGAGTTSTSTSSTTTSP
jgi:hypothetical protein